MEQLYNQKNNTATTRSVQIDFMEAKVLDNCTIAILKPNRVVPKWIEHAEISLYTSLREMSLKRLRLIFSTSQKMLCGHSMMMPPN